MNAAQFYQLPKATDLCSVKPENLDEDILSFPAKFMADVILINMKRLPLRLKEEEEAGFDKNADKYADKHHVHDLSSTRNDRKQRISEDVEVRRTESDFDSRNVLAAEAAETAVPERKTPTEAAPVNEYDRRGLRDSAGCLSGKAKEKSIKRSV